MGTLFHDTVSFDFCRQNAFKAGGSDGGGRRNVSTLNGIMGFLQNLKEQLTLN